MKGTTVERTLAATFDTGAVAYLDADPATRRSLYRQARAEWKEFRKANGFRSVTPFLTRQESQSKLAKNVRPTIGLTLAPANMAGVGNVCPAATGGCLAACLGPGSGKGRMPRVRKARVVRTKFLVLNGFWAGVLIAHELTTFGNANNWNIAIRLNIVSNIRWNLAAPGMMARFVALGAGFYDYSKFRPTQESVRPGYHVTYSAHEKMSDADIVRLVSSGQNVAVVFAASKDDIRAAVAAGATWHGIHLIDGVSTDDRTMDPRDGRIVALAALGEAIGDTSGFVRPFIVTAA